MPIKYLGSKKKLISHIVPLFQAENINSVADVFSGTARVGSALKKAGFQVFANDCMEYARVAASAALCGNIQEHSEQAQIIIDSYNNLEEKKHGYFTETFCKNARYVQPFNGTKIDFIRDDIEEKGYEGVLKDILLTSLMEAADRVDSTCGLQMAYLKKWSKRSYSPLVLRLPELYPESQFGPCTVSKLDAEDFAKIVEADAAYLDPPYNSHSYLGNYHVWESLCLWDKPDTYGIANKRDDVRSRKSNFNSKPKALEALQNTVLSLNVKKIVVSYNNEGFISKHEMESMLTKKGRVQTIEIDYDRYVGAKIGIYNQKSEKVGSAKNLKNKEYIYVVDVD